MLIEVVNPSRRKRRKSGARSKRKASPAQRAARARFAAMARARSGGGRKRRRSHAVSVAANPSRRRRRSAVSRVRSAVRRRFRRNPVSIRSMTSGILPAVTNAFVAAGGGIALDVAMGQALKVLPESVRSRSTLEGGINWGYYGVKGALAVAFGVLGRRLPVVGKYAPRMAEGSLTIQAYEITRALMPADVLALGYYQPATVSSIPGNRVPTRAGAASLGFYANRPLAGNPRRSMQPDTSGDNIGSGMM